MKSENIDLQPAYRLLDKHTQHIKPYEIEFRGINLLLHPEVFNPAYTKVSGFLLDNLEIRGGKAVWRCSREAERWHLLRVTMLVEF